MNRIMNFGSSLRAVAVTVLCGLFLLLALGLALLSSSVYRGAVERSEETYTQRTALAYLANQVRRGDTLGTICTGNFSGRDALAITETGLEGTYVTLLYCYNGQLMELYAEQGHSFNPEDGIAILPLDNLDILLSYPSADKTLLSLAITTGEQTGSVTLSPRCGVREVGLL